MKYITKFKLNGETPGEYIMKHTSPGDVFTIGVTKFIRIPQGAISELGSVFSDIYIRRCEDDSRAGVSIVKREIDGVDYLEDMLKAAESGIWQRYSVLKRGE